MRLGIISDCIHYKTPAGRVATENHILLRQLQELCRHFTSVTICCPFIPLTASTVYTEYSLPNISFIKLPNAGGNSLKAKLEFLKVLPSWFRAFRKVDKASDIVYQRFPNNLNIPGFFYFYLKGKKAFATYTGTWAGYHREPSTYRLQRWLLAKWFRGPVWVYAGKTNNQRILPGISPSYSINDWQKEEEQVQQRICRIKQSGIDVYRLITVGTLIDYKNQTGIVESCRLLRDAGFPFTLTIVGDGPMRQMLSDMIDRYQLHPQVTLAGKKTAAELQHLYRQHDFVVQAPLSEGFGKVPVEGFFHGLIPVINNIAMAATMTGNEERGFLFDASKPQNLADAFLALPAKMGQLPAMINNGRLYAKSQTLEAWAQEYVSTVKTYFEEN